MPAILNADREWLNDLVANGTLDFVYGFVEGGGGVAIANAKSGEELNSIIASSPAFPLLAFEIRRWRRSTRRSATQSRCSSA